MLSVCMKAAPENLECLTVMSQWLLPQYFEASGLWCVEIALTVWSSTARHSCASLRVILAVNLLNDFLGGMPKFVTFRVNGRGGRSRQAFENLEPPSC